MQYEWRSGTEFLKEMVKANLKGDPVGLCSICSANPFVLRSAMIEAKAEDTFLCIESTSNQVNQFGGYTRMNPADFVRFVHRLAEEESFPPDRIILGGDHLGPYPWRQEPAALAMQKAEDLVRSYVEAGFCKIHLDASMRCADDAGDPKTPLNETIVMERTAALARVAEEAASRRGSDVRPVYVVGTEVPVPGGEKTRSQAPEVTSAEDVRSTLEQTKATLERRGLGHVWERVIALVVQPGVEYSDDAVFEYDRCKTANLSALIREAGTCVYEAHSTDYQKPEALSQLVKDHFAILKVGPWLTFAFREAVFALSMIEEEWLGDRRSVELSRVREALESVMVKDPADWQGYYTGDEAYLRYARRYSFSDRCRYYWPRPEVQAALSRLVSNLKNYPPPLTLISQFLPVQYEGVRAGVLSADPTALICDKIAGVLRLYSKACRLGLFGRESAG